MSNYNPFTASITAVISEVTSDNAKAYYASRALEDIDRVITVCEAVYAIASMFYELGAVVSEAHYSAVTDYATSAQPDEPKALPSFTPIAALPPARDRKRNTVEAIANPVLLTKAPVQALLQSLEDTEATRKASYLKLTKKALIDRCAARGLEPRRSMTKKHLAELLTQSYGPVKPHQVRASNGRIYNIA